MTALTSTAGMYDLRMSDAAQPLFDAVVRFVAEEVAPHTEEYFRRGEGRAERWGYGEGQLELLDAIKAKAKQQGLWNFFLPNAETGEGLSNLDYAYIAIELGKNPIASECRRDPFRVRDDRARRPIVGCQEHRLPRCA